MSIEDSFGSGKVNIEYFSNPDISWKEKAIQAALFNGCPEPESVVAKKAKELQIQGVTDPEEAAKLATRHYLSNNFIYSMMVDLAKKKGDKSLFIDMTSTPHEAYVSPTFEEDHVPENYRSGMMTGLATDQPFGIVKKIIGIWNTKYPQEAKRTRFCKALDILEQQIGVSNDITQLHKNFMEALKPRKLVKSILNK